MNKKLLTLIFVGILVVSCLNIASAVTKVKCPTCHGTGSVDCPKCDGTGYVGDTETVDCVTCDGTGTIVPRVQQRTLHSQIVDGQLEVNATFENKEDFDVNSNVTVTVDGRSVTSDYTDFPAGEYVSVIINVDTDGIDASKQPTVKVNADEITCPDCNGEGTTTGGDPCNYCDGTGQVECTDCNGTGKVASSAIAANDTTPWIIGGVVAAVVVAGVGVGLFFLLKRGHTNEKGLRKLSERDFHDWVLKKVGGRSATSADEALGLNGFTSTGLPLAIKQSDSVNMNTIDLFASSVARSKARNGVIVAFGFSDDAIRGKVRARRNYGLDIQMVTVRELVETRGRASL